MSISSSTPLAHTGYILNSSLLESDLKMSKSHVNAVSFDENVSHLLNLLSETNTSYEQNSHWKQNKHRHN